MNVGKAQSYISRIQHPIKRQYAKDYLDWMLDTSKPEPIKPKGLVEMAAHEVRMQLRDILYEPAQEEELESDDQVCHLLISLTAKQVDECQDSYLGYLQNGIELGQSTSPAKLHFWAIQNGWKFIPVKGSLFGGYYRKGEEPTWEYARII